MAPKAEKAKRKRISVKKTRERAAKAVGDLKEAIKNVPPKVMWTTLGTIASIFFLIFFIMTILYAIEKTSGNKLEQPMRELRIIWAKITKNSLINVSSIKALEEVVRIKEHEDVAKAILEDGKSQYAKIFQKQQCRSSNGWQFYGRSLYYISKGEKSWHDAEYFCMSRDAHLASIHSDEEQTFITSELTSPAWIGLSAEEEDGMWEWTDGSRYIKQFWLEGKPSNLVRTEGNEQACALIVPSAGGLNWNDTHCHKLNRWVCKENLDIDEP